ncbi:MAG: hypothetical protein OXU96_09240, partial [Gammaproteobacteria bacterium]|nr:hypothetical protein [Gammaproteobacteria bacterium]
MSDKPPHFMYAHRKPRAAAPLMYAHRKRRAVAPALLGVAIAAAFLFAPVFHGVSQAAYFTQAEGLFNHVRLLGQMRDGQPPQLVPTPARTNPTDAVLGEALTRLLRGADLFLSGTPGVGRTELFLSGIRDGRVTLVGSGLNAQIQCPTCIYTADGSQRTGYTSPAANAFFSVVHDRLDATQTFVSTNDRRVTFTIVGIDTGEDTLAAEPFFTEPAALERFTVYVNGVQRTPTDFVMASQSGVTDPVSGLNADIVSASVIIANSADQPTSATFGIRSGHRGTAENRMQQSPGFRTQRTVTFAARQGPPPPPPPTTPPTAMVRGLSPNG